MFLLCLFLVSVDVYISHLLCFPAYKLLYVFNRVMLFNCFYEIGKTQLIPNKRKLSCGCTTQVGIAFNNDMTL